MERQYVGVKRINPYGRFKIYRSPAGPNTTRLLLDRGWDGYIYQIVGKRGRCGMFYKSAKTGNISDPVFTGSDKSLSW